MSKVTIDPKFKEGVSFMLKRVPCKWAKVHQPDTMYEHKWTINAVLNSKQAEELKGAGFNVRVDKDGDHLLEVKSKVKGKDGRENKAPDVVGPDGKTKFTDNIGNGSIVNIKVFAKQWNVTGKTGISAYLNGVQVIEHVEYTGGVEGFTDESGGNEDSPF